VFPELNRLGTCIARRVSIRITLICIFTLALAVILIATVVSHIMAHLIACSHSPAMFDGSVFHGVVPGRVGGVGGGGGGGAIAPHLADARRITLMIAFWEDISPQLDLGDGHPGASQKFPHLHTTKYTWPSLLTPQSFCPPNPLSSYAPTHPFHLPSVWEDVDAQANKRDACGYVRARESTHAYVPPAQESEKVRCISCKLFLSLPP
jgi:hypothetical protein